MLKYIETINSVKLLSYGIYWILSCSSLFLYRCDGCEQCYKVRKHIVDTYILGWTYVNQTTGFWQIKDGKTSMRCVLLNLTETTQVYLLYNKADQNREFLNCYSMNWYIRFIYPYLNSQYKQHGFIFLWRGHHIFKVVSPHGHTSYRGHVKPHRVLYTFCTVLSKRVEGTITITYLYKWVLQYSKKTLLKGVKSYLEVFFVNIWLNYLNQYLSLIKDFKV